MGEEERVVSLSARARVWASWLEVAQRDVRRDRISPLGGMLVLAFVWIIFWFF